MYFAAYRSFFVNLSFFHLLLSFGVLLLSRKAYNLKYWGFIAIAFLAGMSAEWIGVHTGYLFGDYAYGAVLGPKLFAVPLIIGVNWAMLSIVSAALLDKLKLGARLEIIFAALLMVFLDYLMEPVAIKLGFWHWKNGAIPAFNYVCWLLVSLGIQYIYSKWRLNESNNVAIALFFYIVAFFTILDIYL
jgi:putative membrane protein